MGLGQGGGGPAQLLPAQAGKGTKPASGPALGMVAGWSLGDGGALLGMSHEIADVPLLTGWPATSMSR